MSAAVVYRFYDADLRLLYVGYSTNMLQRLGGHRSTFGAWDDVDTITVEHFASKDEAIVAEAAAIRDERPMYNLKGREAELKELRAQQEVQRVAARRAALADRKVRVNLSLFDVLARLDGLTNESITERLTASGWPASWRRQVIDEGASLAELDLLAAVVRCPAAALSPALGGFTEPVTP